MLHLGLTFDELLVTNAGWFRVSYAIRLVM